MLARTSSKSWTEIVRVDILALFPILGGKVFNASLLSLIFFFLYTFEKMTLFSREHLISQKNWTESTEHSHVLSFLHSQFPLFLTYCIGAVHLMNVYVPTDKWLLTLLLTKVYIYIRINPFCCTFCGFWQMYVMYPAITVSYRIVSLP